MLRSSRIAVICLLCLCLGACSFSSSKFYQNDGPPRFSISKGTKSAIPKVEPLVKATTRPYTVLGKTYTPIATDKKIIQIGMGSWYGKQFHGNKTSTGERYDMYLPTAAHPTMPLPSYARVTNLENGRSIIVRVNDRGPFLNNRIIDLSYAAAQSLGYEKKGTAKVRVERFTNDEIRSGRWKTNIIATKEGQTDNTTKETIKENVSFPEPTKTQLSSVSTGYSVQVGSFKNFINAQTEAAHTEALLPEMKVRIVNDKGYYRVLINQNLPLEQARSLAEELSEKLGMRAFVIQK